MRAAICSVGSEMLLGDQTDTNATWLSAQLTARGIDVIGHAAVGDDLERIVGTLRFLAADAELIVIGGGLGPTPDDLTRAAVAAFAGVEIQRDADLEEALIQSFAQRGWRMPASNLQQADVPVGAETLAPQGTAPGLWFETGSGVTLVALPGVPWEMKAMFSDAVAPRLVDLVGAGVTITRSVRVVGMPEAGVGETVGAFLDQAARADGTAWSILASGGEIRVRVTVTAGDDARARAVAQPLIGEVARRLGTAVSALDDESSASALVRLMRERGQTVAFAESATAGMIASRLGEVPGASAVLAGGIVTYATSSKAAVLGIDPGLLREHPPVSEAVTAAMAEQVRARFSTTFGVAVTGVAGPDGQDGVEVGQVFFAVAGPDGTRVHGRAITGDREQVRTRLATAALDALRRAAIAAS